MAIDLHIHSNASADGEFPAAEIVQMAQRLGLQAISITDHDTVLAQEEALSWGEKLQVEVIPGCEIFARYQGEFLHILGYYIDYRDSSLLELLSKVDDDRHEGIDRQIQKLREAGLFLEKEKVMEECHNTIPLYSSYANAVFTDPRNAKHPLVRLYESAKNPIMEFSLNHMAIGKEFYITQYIPEAAKTIELIRSAGGVAILAHPGTSLPEKETVIIDDLLGFGLTGLEVYTSHHNSEQEAFYLNYCKQKGILYTCGSDYHGNFKPNVKLGGITNNTYDIVRNLRSYQSAP